jgi:hypothetical protein
MKTLELDDNSIQDKLLDNDLERASRNVLVTPLDDKKVVARIVDYVTDVVLVAANVADVNFFAR